MPIRWPRLVLGVSCLVLLLGGPGTSAALAQPLDWAVLMRQWNQAILNCPVDAAQVPADALSARWLGAPGATDADIQALEARLGVQLPPSYVAFLRFSNGWRSFGRFITNSGELWPTARVDWLRVRHPDVLTAWMVVDARHGGPLSVPDAEYFVYGDTQDTVTMRTEYMPDLLEVSEEGDAELLLLNPRITFPDGEWEAWDLASWYPGAARYRSFGEMMQTKFAELLPCGNQ
jgi:SMI1/KNR4 family protein SUKH-1